MKPYRTLLALFVAVLLAAFSTSCQRNDKSVQAAREEKVPEPGATNSGGMANMGDTNVLSAQDRDTAAKIEQANMEEIDLGRYVRDKTDNEDVKSFAKMMIDDHNAALNKLQDLLKDKNVSPSTTMKPEDEASMMSQLQNASGSDLNREYMSMMVQDHQKDLEELQNAQASVQNPDLKNYIAYLIPVVQKHLDKAQEIENTLAKTETR